MWAPLRRSVPDTRERFTPRARQRVGVGPHANRKMLEATVIEVQRQMLPMLGSSGSFVAGVAAAYEAMIRKGKWKGAFPNIICEAGDGSASDIGIGSVSGGPYRNHHFLIICYDNEQYGKKRGATRDVRPEAAHDRFYTVLRVHPGDAVLTDNWHTNEVLAHTRSNFEG